MSSEQQFRVALSQNALKYYQKVDTDTAARLDHCFKSLEQNPFGRGDIKPLRGIEGRYRYRVGKLRVIYGVDLEERVVKIFAIQPRGKAY
ncbi:type II toxin-antitoxin system RelE/ParE family toxin [Dehalococcoidales bacterium]|nr:type II toxin-antitoxin system RelE/ParE family toxin [Dehalococcoidales bacterium]